MSRTEENMSTTAQRGSRLQPSRASSEKNHSTHKIEFRGLVVQNLKFFAPAAPISTIAEFTILAREAGLMPIFRSFWEPNFDLRLTIFFQRIGGF